MKSASVLKVLSSSLLSVFLLQGCNDKGGGTAPAAGVPRDQAVVQPTTVDSCNLRRASYNCYLNAETPEGPGQFQLNIEVSGKRQGRKTISTNGLIYKADGRVHGFTNDSGIRVRYNVVCNQDAFEIHVDSLNSPHSMRLNMDALRSERPSIEFYSNGRNGRTTGTGTCWTR